MYKLIAVCAFIAFGTNAAEFQTPNWLRLCSRGDGINACLKNSIQEALPDLRHGSREFNLPAMDPFFLKDDQMTYKTDGIKIIGKLSKMNVYGFSSAIVDDARFTMDEGNFRLEIDFSSPNVLIETDYKVSGMVDRLPVNGKGFGNCSMHDLKYTMKLWGAEESRHGENFIKITGFEMKPEIGDMKVYISDLLVGELQVREVANSMANEYWPWIYNILLPYAESHWNVLAIDEANKIFQKIPSNRLFAKK